MAEPLKIEPNFYAQEQEQWAYQVNAHELDRRNNRAWGNPSSPLINNVHMIPHPVIHPQQLQSFHSLHGRESANQSPINTIESSLDHVYHYGRDSYNPSSILPSYRRVSIGSNCTKEINGCHSDHQEMTRQDELSTSDDTFISSIDDSSRSNSPTATQVSCDNIDDILSLADEESLQEFFANEVPEIAPVEPCATDDIVEETGSRDFDTFMSTFFP